MTEKQKRFADEYLIDLNATRAYKATYPTVKREETAGTNGWRMLKNAEVKAYIAQRLEEMQSSKIADAQEVLEYLTSVVRGESESQIVVIEGQGEGFSAARKVHKNPDEKERLKAAELMAKYHQLLIPKVQIEAEQSGGVIVLADVKPLEPPPEDESDE